MSRRVHILFLEDEFVLRTTLAQGLQQAGYDVEAAASLQAAREALRLPADEFDVLVLNVRLEDGDGIDLCAELRASGVNTPILMHSGFDDIETYQRAFEAGADYYLRKSYRQQDLVEHVEFLLRLPPLARVRRGRGAADSNLPTVQEHCDGLVRSALAHLAVLRPAPGTLSREEWELAGNAKPLPFHEESAAALERALVELRRALDSPDPNLGEISRLRAAILALLQPMLNWLAARATVAADEMVKFGMKVGIAAAVAHAAGLKLDLMHIVAALGALAGGK